MLIVDTDVLIDVQRGFAPALEWFSNLSELPAVTGFTVLELIQDARDRSEVVKALRLVKPLSIIWPQASDYEKALECYAKVHLSHRVGLLDVLIAYAAIGLNAELCTFNAKHFRVVPGLHVSQPYSR